MPWEILIQCLYFSLETSLRHTNPSGMLRSSRAPAAGLSVDWELVVWRHSELLPPSAAAGDSEAKPGSPARGSLLPPPPPHSVTHRPRPLQLYSLTSCCRGSRPANLRTTGDLGGPRAGMAKRSTVLCANLSLSRSFCFRSLRQQCHSIWKSSALQKSGVFTSHCSRRGHLEILSILVPNDG